MKKNHRRYVARKSNKPKFRSPNRAMQIAIAITIAVLVLWPLMAMTTSADEVVNTVTVKDSRSLYEAQSAMPFIAVPNAVNSNKAAAGIPGDTDPYFFVHAPTFVREGDRFAVRVITIRDIPGPTQIGGRVYYPGPSGHFDEQGRLGYFRSAYYPDGLRMGSLVTVYTAEINGEYGRGEHIIDLTLWSSDGQLLQQTFHPFGMIDAGPYVPWLRVTSAVINSRNDGFELTGTFSHGARLWYFIGVPGDSYLIGSTSASANGKKLKLSGMMQYSRVTPVDFIVLDPFTRHSTTKLGLIELEPANQ